MLCVLCGNNIHNPRELLCGHFVCRCCLMESLDINIRRNILVSCPKGCLVRTFIPIMQRLDDLSCFCRIVCREMVDSYCISCASFVCPTCREASHQKCKIRVFQNCEFCSQYYCIPMWEWINECWIRGIRAQVHNFLLMSNLFISRFCS